MKPRQKDVDVTVCLSRRLVVCLTVSTSCGLFDGLGLLWSVSGLLVACFDCLDICGPSKRLVVGLSRPHVVWLTVYTSDGMVNRIHVMWYG